MSLMEVVQCGNPAELQGGFPVTPEEELTLTGILEAGSLEAFALNCASDTLDELIEENCLPKNEKKGLISDFALMMDGREEGEPIPDMLLFLAQRKTGAESEEALVAEMDRNVEVLLRSGKRRKLVRYPFLHLTRMPSIYRDIPAVKHFCRVLMVPVVQAHEKELITLATINPVTGTRAMEAISQIVEEASGRRPIPALTIALSAHWRQLNRKHFGA